jgi:hypothetical protein
MIIVCDDAAFTADNLRNYLWVTFTSAIQAMIFTVYKIHNKI